MEMGGDQRTWTLSAKDHITQVQNRVVLHNQPKAKKCRDGAANRAVRFGHFTSHVVSVG